MESKALTTQQAIDWLGLPDDHREWKMELAIAHIKKHEGMNIKAKDIELEYIGGWTDGACDMYHIKFRDPRDRRKWIDIGAWECPHITEFERHHWTQWKRNRRIDEIIG